MKVSVVFAAIIALCASTAIRESSKDRSYIDGVSRYAWMSNDEGELVQVDLQEPITDEEDNSRSGANNQYWLYTRQNPTNSQILVNGDANSVSSSNYRADKPTITVAHGWTSSGTSNISTVVRDAFLAADDCNVIVVDWNAVAGGSYVSAVIGVPNVGRSLGNFLEWLVTSTDGNWDLFHLVGHSLGAHVVGNAGRAVGGKPTRVSGLDPAGPLWEYNSNRLSPYSGQYVEAIHTDGDLQGIFIAVGDVDFYPNGGRNPQPGCEYSMCSHTRAYLLFASSIRTNRFVGRQCTDLDQASLMQCSGAMFNMGNDILSKRGKGLFGLETGSSWPF